MDAHVLALLDQLHRVQLAEAQQLTVLERDGALQPDAPTVIGELEHQLVERSGGEGSFGAEHQRHQQPTAVALGDPCLHALATGAHDRDGIGALGELDITAILRCLR